MIMDRALAAAGARLSVRLIVKDRLFNKAGTRGTEKDEVKVMNDLDNKSARRYSSRCLPAAGLHAGLRFAEKAVFLFFFC